MRRWGLSIGKLVVVEYLFHVTLVLGAALLALYLVRAAEARTSQASRYPVPVAQALAVQPAAVVVKRVLGQGPQR